MKQLLTFITYIIIYTLYTKRIKPYGHQATEASLTSEFTSPGLNTGRGNNPFIIYLWRTKTPLIQIFFPAPTGRGTNPYKPTE